MVPSKRSENEVNASLSAFSFSGNWVTIETLTNKEMETLTNKKIAYAGTAG
jgi:hypothetical protein